jgi:putative transposase
MDQFQPPNHTITINPNSCRDAINRVSTRYKNQYRIKSARLPNFDYSTENAYFITICTKNRHNYFGNIIDDLLSESFQANICQKIWNELPNHYQNCELDEFIIMPNHIHGIIILSSYTDAINRVSTTMGGITNKHNPMLNNNLSAIIRTFKAKSTHQIHKIDPNFAWQSRFFDRIIRSEDELDRIRYYIQANPANWSDDKNNINKL